MHYIIISLFQHLKLLFLYVSLSNDFTLRTSNGHLFMNKTSKNCMMETSKCTSFKCYRNWISLFSISGEEAFCDAFPSLYALASNKEAFVVDMWEHSREEGGWSPCFTGPFNDWELDKVHSFFQTIQRMRVFPR